MLHTVSPWTTTVQKDIEANPAFFATAMPGCSISVHNAEGSIWIMADQANLGKMAFRVAFGMGKNFDKPSVRESSSWVTIHAETVLGDYKIRLQLLPHKRMLRYTTVCKPKEPLLTTFWPRDIVPLTENGRVENTTATIHVQQIGSRSGQLFFTQTRPNNGTIFYLQNFSALTAYCEDTQTTVAETVGGTWPEIGFKLQSNPDLPILAGKEYVLSDAFVLMQPDSPKDAFDVATLYLDGLAKIYEELPRPATDYRDWINISKKGLDALQNNKGCWMYSGGHAYLNAYLCDYKTPPEIMVQLAVLFAIVEYNDWTGHNLEVVNDIQNGIQAFYDPKLKTLARWLPRLRGNLDESEEQKAAMTMDSWYLHHPLMTLSRLALKGDKQAEQLLLESVEYAITVAHHFNYEWPVFYKMDTLEILKPETSPGMGGEKDVAGSYTHIMVNLYRLTKEKRYLDEAVKAAKSLEQFGLDIFYQANNTASSALALLRLYQETRNDLHLKLGYLCLAGVMKNVQLFESGYGHSKHFPNFFGVYPLNDAPYKAPYEELEVYAALNDYIKEADEMNAPILPAIKLLLAEFVRYSINRLPYYYPPMLPTNILADEVKTGELDPKLWIPVEDLYDGWDQNGKVGQEVYGAGVGFGVVPRQYIKLDNENLMLFTDYPIVAVRRYANRVTFRILGDTRLKCHVALIGNSKKLLSTVKGECKTGNVYHVEEGRHIDGMLFFDARGDSHFRITW